METVDSSSVRADLERRIAALSPEQRRLLQAKFRARGSSAHDAPIPRSGGDRYSPLSFEQQRLWFLHQLDSTNPVYNVHRAWELRGPLDVDALDRALRTIVARHSVLRFLCEVVDEEPVQMTAEPVDRPLAVVDLSGLSPPQREARCADLNLEESRRPFDLSRGPIFRPILVRRSEEDHILMLTLHHIVCDGWSLSVLHDELSVLYNAFIAGAPSPLEELPIQFGDYASWQRDRWRAGDLEPSLEYWRKQLAGLSTLELPTDRPRPPRATYRGDRERLRLSARLTRRLRTLAREENTTLFSLLLAGFKSLLHGTTGQDDIAIGTPMANRRCKELEPMIGMVVNTLVLRTNLGGDPTFRELLRRVRDTSLEAIDHQDAPFGKLVEDLRPERDLRRNPLFQVSFTLQNTPDPTPTLAGLSVTPFGAREIGLLPASNGTSKFDLAVQLIESGDGVAGSLEYSTDLFDPPTIERMARSFEVVLERIASDPRQRLSSLRPGPEVERRHAAGEPRPGLAVATDRCVHELFESRAKLIPGTVAVVADGRQITYGELDRRANQLAHHLVNRGAVPGTLVGVRVNPSPELVVSVLGVLKAGAAYVPLDPARPGEGPDPVIAEVSIEIVLTDQRRGDPGELHIVEDWTAIAAESDEKPRSEVSSGDPACVLERGAGAAGSAGRVQVAHRSVVAFLSAMGQEPGMIASDALLSTAPTFRDLSLLDLFLPLAAGARLILASRAARSDGAALLERLRETRATMMHAAPGVYRGMIDAGWERRFAVRLVCAGEPLPRGLAGELAARAHEVWSLEGAPGAGAVARRVE